MCLLITSFGKLSVLKKSNVMDHGGEKNNFVF